MKTSERSGPSIRKPTVSVYSARMGDGKGGHREVFGELHGFGCERLQGDVLELDQLIPGPVLFEERAHRGSAVDRHAAGAIGLAPQMHESGVVTHVRMGQEDPVHERCAGAVCTGFEAPRRRVAFGQLHLAGQVGGGVEQPALAARRVAQQEGGYQAPTAGLTGAPGQGMPRADLRKAGVLGGAQDST